MQRRRPTRCVRQFALLISLLKFGPQPFKLPLMKSKIGLLQASFLRATDFTVDQFGDVGELETFFFMGTSLLRWRFRKIGDTNNPKI